MPVTPAFDPATGANGGASGGGGGSTFDVSPPAAATQVKAAGASFVAHTFGSFTGADAGSIDGYTARIVNAVGSTSWSGSGLGAWTPSGDADGNSGTLALDATIGGVVVATAILDYSRAAPAGAGLETVVDISGIASLDLLAGGEGLQNVPSGPGGINQVWKLDFLGTSGPTVLRITNGVIEFEGDPTTNRGLISINMSAGGFAMERYPIMVYVSIENCAIGQSMNWTVAQNQTGTNAANEAQFLPGTNSSSSAVATALLTRENKTGGGSPSFTTVKAWNSGLTDVTTTPTRMACRIMGGSWQPSFDQGTATLPADGDNLSNYGNKQHNDFQNASAPQARDYIKLNLRDDCDVRVIAYKGTT
jgi:hypothetical protein